MCCWLKTVAEHTCLMPIYNHEWNVVVNLLTQHIMRLIIPCSSIFSLSLVISCYNPSSILAIIMYVLSTWPSGDWHGCRHSKCCVHTLTIWHYDVIVLSLWGVCHQHFPTYTRPSADVYTVTWQCLLTCCSCELHKAAFPFLSIKQSRLAYIRLQAEEGGR